MVTMIKPALAMATVGVYGVVAYSASRRSHEIGVRMALGAKPGALIRMVVRQGMRLALIGVAMGLGLSASIAAGHHGKVRPFSP